MIDFIPIYAKGRKEGEYFFTLCLRNYTNSYVDIGPIITKKGVLYFASEERIKGRTITKFDNKYKKKEFPFGWKKLLPSNCNQTNTPHSKEVKIELKYIGEKTKIYVEFEFADAPKSIIFSNRKGVSRIIPLSFLA